MKNEISVEDLKHILLEILEYVDSFCEKNSINYFLCGGTALGAVRHKGFIPWDDDIDIMIPRPDYDKFIELMSKDSHTFYKLHSIEIDNSYIYSFAKVCDERTILEENVNRPLLGIAIDIFPIDGFPNNPIQSDKFIKRIKRINHLFQIKLVRTNKSMPLYKRVTLPVLQCILKLCSARKISFYVITQCRKNDFSKSNYIGNIVWGYYNKEKTNKKVFEKSIRSLFEGQEFPLMQGYDEYLTNLYGNYMELPPEGKRHSPHTLNNIYWKK
jgi:lipopolysaccharide cholinephosphotransferase